MTRLTKEQRKRLEELRTRWIKAHGALETERENAAESLHAVQGAINDCVADLNALVAEANSLREEIETEAQDYSAEKSDRWQEGERGQAYAEWLSAWQNEVDEIEEIEIEVPEVEVPEALLPEDDYPDEPAS